MKFKRSVYNVLFGLLSQIIILVLGLIIPRLFLVEYGSETNGLFSTVNQIFVYVALLEAGVGAATIQALYKPIINNDRELISTTLSTTKSYYKKITLYYFFCVVGISIIFPLVINSTINKVYIGLIILIQGFSGMINFYFQATLKQMLLAEGKNYVISNIELIVYVLSSITKILLIYFKFNIVFIQLGYCLINIIQMLIYHIYFRKKYDWINFEKKPKYELLNQKNSFLIHQISLLIFSSTDVMLLSLFCDLKVASVYAVYNLIFLSINGFLGMIYNSISFSLGHTYHEDKNRYLKIHDSCEVIYITLVFSIISVAYILTIPFIRIYTSGIIDINYVDRYLPLLFCIIQLLTSIRMISNNLIRISDHTKKTISRTIVESIINLTVSLVLVNAIGIYGVLIGTIVALLYRTNDILIYANKIIIKRKPQKIYKTVIVNFILFTIVVYLNSFANINIENFSALLVCGIIVSIITFLTYFFVNYFFSINEIKFIINTVKKKK